MSLTHNRHRITVLSLLFIIASLVFVQSSHANNSDNSWTVVSGSPSQTDSSSGAGQRNGPHMLAPGTPYATPYYVNDSGKSGPTVMVVGGVHGNEIAGYTAARRLISTVPKRGKLIVIPEANILGVKDRARIGRHPGDLNRDFPRSRSDQPNSVLAKSIWDLVQTVKPDYVIDLHEGYDFHKLNSNSVGQSIIYYPKGNTNKLAQAMQSAVNSGISTAAHKYSLLKYPVKGSLTRSAAMFTPAKTMILETSRKQPLNVRVEQHITMVHAALKYLDMMS